MINKVCSMCAHNNKNNDDDEVDEEEEDEAYIRPDRGHVGDANNE